MDQDTPMTTGYNSSTGTDFGASSGTGASAGTGTSTGTSTGSDAGSCPHCGQSMNRGAGLDQFLGKLGINEDMINSLKTQFQNVDIDEYLNTAREYLKTGGDYLKTGSDKASSYAKENPGKVAAGVATLALGAGLLYAAINRDR